MWIRLRRHLCSVRTSKCLLLLILFVAVLMAVFSLVQEDNSHLVLSSWRGREITGRALVNVTSQYYKLYRPDRLVTNFDCRPLLRGERDTIEVARKIQADQIDRNLREQFLTYLTLRGCGDFIEHRGYVMEDEDSDYPIAFSIVFHENLSQVERLLRAIYRPQHLICLHLDAKAPMSSLIAVRALSRCFPNVLLAQQENVVYASFSRLQAEINCMKVALSHAIPWKYYINLVGKVFPLKTNSEMVQILKIYNQTNDVEGLDQLEIRSRYEYVYKVDDQSIRNTSERHSPPPHGLRIVRGSTYGIFSRAFVHFMLHDRVATDLLDWSRDTYSPDEHFWSTLHHLQLNPHLNTPGGYRGSPMGKEWLAAMVSWEGHQEEHCYSRRYVRGICIYGVADLQQLTNSKAFFANKFEEDFEPLTLGCLEEWHYNRTRFKPPLDVTFYKNLKFVEEGS